jgi:hypothetical protein
VRHLAQRHGAPWFHPHRSASRSRDYYDPRFSGIDAASRIQPHVRDLTCGVTGPKYRAVATKNSDFAPPNPLGAGFSFAACRPASAPNASPASPRFSVAHYPNRIVTCGGLRMLAVSLLICYRHRQYPWGPLTSHPKYPCLATDARRPHAGCREALVIRCRGRFQSSDSTQHSSVPVPPTPHSVASIRMEEGRCCRPPKPSTARYRAPALA